MTIDGKIKNEKEQYNLYKEAAKISTLSSFMLKQSSRIHSTIDLKNKKHNTGCPLLSESHSISPLDSKPPRNSC